MGSGCTGRSGGGRISVPAGMDRSLVPEPPALQGVRREADAGPDHIQRRLRLLLQPPPACSLRDNPSSFQTV